MVRKAKQQTRDAFGPLIELMRSDEQDDNKHSQEKSNDEYGQDYIEVCTNAHFNVTKFIMTLQHSIKKNAVSTVIENAHRQYHKSKMP